MKTKAKKITRRKRNPQENSTNRIKALRFIMSTCENISKHADRASRHLSMVELANIATYVDEVQNVITHVNKVATTRVKDYDRISHFCNAKNGMCGETSAIDWIYYLGSDLFGFSIRNRILGGGFVISHEALHESNIVKFDQKFKEYLTSNPVDFNYLVLNYMKYQIKSDYYPIVGYQGKSYQYYKFSPEILLEWYGKYLTKLGLQKYIPSDKEIEFVFSVY